MKLSLIAVVRANELADANNECILTEFSLSRDVSYSYNYRTRTSMYPIMLCYLYVLLSTTSLATAAFDECMTC